MISAGVVAFNDSACTNLAVGLHPSPYGRVLSRQPSPLHLLGVEGIYSSLGVLVGVSVAQAQGPPANPLGDGGPRGLLRVHGRRTTIINGRGGRPELTSANCGATQWYIAVSHNLDVSIRRRPRVGIQDYRMRCCLYWQRMR